MPRSVRYPLERERDLQGRWGHLLQRTARSTRSDLLPGVPALVDTTPPDEEDREPAVIREPDKDK